MKERTGDYMNKQIDLKALLESKVGNITPIEGSREYIERVEAVVPKNLMFDAEVTEFRPETKPMTSSGARGLTVEEAKQSDDEMNRFIDAVLVAGVDYGVIPHCTKPTLLKPGAEKIMNYLGLIARTVITNRVEDFNVGFFSYECKVYLLDYNGVVRGEGVGLTNTRETKYAKQNGYSVQNVVLKMAKKRALTDAILNVGALSARFTQDVEDMNIEADHLADRPVADLPTSKSRSNSDTVVEKPVTQKQIKFLESLIVKNGTTTAAVDEFVKKKYGIDNYRLINSFQASELIEKFKALGV